MTLLPTGGAIYLQPPIIRVSKRRKLNGLRLLLIPDPIEGPGG